MATITLNLSPQNDAPLARADVFEFNPAATLTLPVLRNDVDPDGEPQQVSVIRTLVAAGLSTSVDPSGQIILNLPAGFTGLAGVEYQVRDAAGSASTAIAMAFVGMPKLEMMLSAKGLSGRRELHLTDFASMRQITDAVDGDVSQYFLSADKSKVAYVRAVTDSATGSVLSTSLHVQPLAAGANGRNVPLPAGRSISVSSWAYILPNLALSSDGRWLAFIVTVDGSQTQQSQQTELYLLDTNSAVAVPVRVTASLPAALWGLVFHPTGELTLVGSTVGPVELNGLFVPSEVYSMRPDSPATITRLSVAQNDPVPGVNANVFVHRNAARGHFFFTGQRAIGPTISVVDPTAPGIESRIPQAPVGAFLSGIPSVASDRDTIAAICRYSTNPLSYCLLVASVSGVRPAASIPIDPGFVPSSRSPSVVKISPDSGRVLLRSTELNAPGSSTAVYLREVNLQNPALDRDLGSVALGGSSVLGFYSADGGKVLLQSFQGRSIMVDLASPSTRVETSPAVPVQNSRTIDGRIYLQGSETGLHAGNFYTPTASFDLLSLGNSLISPVVLDSQFGSRTN